MKSIKLLGFILVAIACVGCGVNKTNFVYEIPQATVCANSPFAEHPELIDSQDGDYYVWIFRGSYYVAASKKSSSAFEKKLLLPNSVKKEKAGPHGETVYFESDPKNSEVLSRLQAKFEAPKLLISQDDDYFVWKIGRNIYLFGDYLTNERFIIFNEIPASREVLYKAGPNGENVIYEIREKSPDFGKFLLERYLDGPFVIKESCDNFTIWEYQQKYYVIGSPDINLRFQTYREIPYSQAYLDYGPEGKTVIFEDIPGNPGYLNYLKNRFLREMEKNSVTSFSGENKG